MLTETIVTLKRSFVTKDHGSTLEIGNENLQTTTKDKTNWDIAIEILRGTLGRKKNERYVSCVFRVELHRFKKKIVPWRKIALPQIILVEPWNKHKTRRMQEQEEQWLPS